MVRRDERLLQSGVAVQSDSPIVTLLLRLLAASGRLRSDVDYNSLRRGDSPAWRSGNAHWCLLALWGTWVFTGPGYANEPTAEQEGNRIREIVEKIIATNSRVNDEINPCLIRYDVREFMSAEFLRALRREPTGEPRSGQKYSDLNYVVQAEIARKQDRFRQAYSGPTIEEGVMRDANPAKSDVRVYDGSRSIALRHLKAASGVPRYEVSASAKFAEKGYSGPWNLSLTNDAMRMLNAYLAGESEPLVTIEPRNADTEFVRLLFTYENGWTNRLTFLTRPSLLLAEYQVFDSKLHQLSVTKTEYEVHSGVPIPSHVTHLSYDEAGVLLKSSELIVTEVITDAALIPDELFKMDIPDNAAVHDDDVGALVRTPEQVQQALEKMSAVAKPTMYRWLIWINLALLVFAAGFFSRRLFLSRRKGK